jgi:hypothetical protein
MEAIRLPCTGPRSYLKIREEVIAQLAQQKIGSVLMFFTCFAPELHQWHDDFFFTPGFGLVQERDFPLETIDTYTVYFH